ncbi:MAG: GerMN domain-containing protein [Candidatus Gastranaerophilales bacterium]|nr:GerMN domain-containing protein [Candidatus Gastranaerophilales bacterium]
MGRKRKRKDRTNIIGILVLVIALCVYAKMTFLKDFNPIKDFDFDFNFPKQEKNIEVTERSVEEDYSAIAPEVKTQIEEDKTVEVFFTKSSGGQDVYVAVPRKKPANNKLSDIEFAVKVLLNGPVKYEHNNGIYSEIPQSTKLLYVKESPNKVIVNLSSDFEFGGGGDSLYKRVYQLIKTVNKNTRKPVYLYIDGKQASVIGGEGLMLRQPLRSNSLDD